MIGSEDDEVAGLCGLKRPGSHASTCFKGMGIAFDIVAVAEVLVEVHEIDVDEAASRGRSSPRVFCPYRRHWILFYPTWQCRARGIRPRFCRSHAPDSPARPAGRAACLREAARRNHGDWRCGCTSPEVPMKGRAMTRPTSCSPRSISRAISQIRYSSGAESPLRAQRSERRCPPRCRRSAILSAHARLRGAE